MESLQELRPLDLKKCRTVGDIVEGMKFCSFGARMLGEVAATLCEIISAGNSPLLVYDGKQNTSLGLLLNDMVERGWFHNIVSPAEYELGNWTDPTVIVGRFSEKHEDDLYQKPERAIFINQFDLARPGQIKDGYFPDAVFADPRFVMPILYHVLKEHLEGKSATVSELIRELAPYGGVAAQVSRGGETFLRMVEDKECLRFLTISGAMTIAKMGLLVCDMIELGMVHAISCTGALMAHGLTESIGLKHYKYDPAHGDEFLAEKKLNRVTDTLEPETNLDSVEEVLDDVLWTFGGLHPISPTELNEVIGRRLFMRFPQERGILRSAYEHDVPVFVPAFIDSELGNDLLIHNRKRREKRGVLPLIVDLERDSERLVKIVTKAERVGIFTVGGGVPRNNVQNVAPLIEIMNDRLGLNLPLKKLSYGVRICPDRPHFGHLSGCTYSEGISWRKMDPQGSFAEIQADATMVWPFLVKYVMERRSV